MLSAWSTDHTQSGTTAAQWPGTHGCCRGTSISPWKPEHYMNPCREHVYRPRFWQEKWTWTHCHSGNVAGQLQPQRPCVQKPIHSLSQHLALPRESPATRWTTSLLQRATESGSKQKSMGVTSAAQNHVQFDPVGKWRQSLNWSRSIWIEGGWVGNKQIWAKLVNNICKQE